MNVPGTKPNIPDHELLRLIGRGSYGEVWLARNIMGTLRAVKIIYRTAFDNARPYEREFAGLQKFEPVSRTHPSQLDILHIGQNEAGAYFYYVMELADDATAERGIRSAESADSPSRDCPPRAAYAPKTLRSEMERRGPLAPAECIEIGLSLSTALAHLHQSGLVHRDIKPSNIIYVNSQVKLADIGLVSAIDATRSYVGTVGYAPYEGPGTPQADIYSLGKVLYEAATARDRQEFPELPTNISGTAEQQQEFLELNEVLIKACDDDPRRRYQTAEQMHEDLLALRSGESLVRLRTVERRFQWARRVGVVALLLVLLITPAYLYQARQTLHVKKLAAQNLALAQEAKNRAEEARRNERTARENLYAADISLAQQALQGDNLRQALDLLKKQIPKSGEPDLRGFEWRYLWQQCQSEELFSLPGHDDAVKSVEFSADGRTLLTASEQTVKVWDLASHRAVATLTNADPYPHVVYSPDGNLRAAVNLNVHAAFSPCEDVLAVATETDISLFDAKNHQLLRVLPGANLKGAFTPNGKYLVTVTTNGLILWDTRTWSALKTHVLGGFAQEPELNHPRFGLACSSDSGRVAVVLNDGIKILSLPSFEQVTMLQDRIQNTVPLALSPDCRVVAAAAPGCGVKLWDIDTGGQTKLLSGHSDSVFGLAFSPDGKKLATASADQTVKLWNSESGELIRTFKGHAEEVSAVAFSPDGKVLASVCKDGTVKVWDALKDAEPSHEIAELRPLGFDSTGNVVGFLKTLRAKHPTVITFEPLSLQATATNEYTFGGRTGKGKLAVYTCNLETLSEDGRTALFGIKDLSQADPGPGLELWDLNRNELVCAFATDEWDGYGRNAKFAPKAGLLALPNRDRTVSIWKIPDHVRTCLVTNAGYLCAFSADGRLVATTKAPREITLWTIDKNSAQQCATLHGDAAEFSPDGTLVAVPNDKSVIEIWAVPSVRLISTLIGHKRTGFKLTFSPDNRTLASLADDLRVRVWHVPTGRELLRFPLPAEDASALALRFSSDGRTLAAWRTGNSGEVTRLWYAPSFAEIAAFDRVAERIALPVPTPPSHAK